MNETELTLLQETIHQLPYPPLFVTVSGAHLYGFPSPDSDFDLRGAHVLPLTSVIGLNRPKETITQMYERERREIDLVTHDIKKFITLMLKKNGYVLEQLYSPLVVQGGAAFEKLRQLGKGCITRHVYHHYHGFARRQIEQFEAENPHRIKTLLYVYRVLMTGIRLLKTGQVEANLPRLNTAFRLPFIPDLIAQKEQEHAVLTDLDLEMHQAAIIQLQQQLETAFQDSPLPEAPTNHPELHDFLVRLRLEAR
jgi:predicted nucleotidyltransferase